MKRTFRVATVFTGAAACAAALTPAAQAAAVPAGGGMAKITPDAIAQSCNLKTTESRGIVLYYYRGDHKPGCVSGTGFAPIGGHPRMSGYCADGVSGSLEVGGVWHRFADDNRVHNLYGQTVSSVWLEGGATGHPCDA